VQDDGAAESGKAGCRDGAEILAPARSGVGRAPEGRICIVAVTSRAGH